MQHPRTNLRRSLTDPSGIARFASALTLFTLMLIVPSLLEPPHTTTTLQPLPSFDTADGKLLVLRPLGDLMERDIDHLARSLEYRLGVDVALLPPLPLPQNALDPHSGRYVADRLLNWMFVTRPRNAWRYVAVTREPLQTGDAHSLYGYANAIDHVAVLSTFHFETSLASHDPLERALARDKLSRAAVHEMAHTVGLDHCDHDRCLMQSVIPLDRLDTRTTLCHDCIRRLSAALAVPNAPWREHLDLGDSFFHRGYHAHALQHYDQAKALLNPPDDVTLATIENRIGASLLSMQ
ncbi:MAG: archaemetzincin, partial [Myxococcota bacterium]